MLDPLQRGIKMTTLVNLYILNLTLDLQTAFKKYRCWLKQRNSTPKLSNVFYFDIMEIGYWKLTIPEVFRVDYHIFWGIPNHGVCRIFQFALKYFNGTFLCSLSLNFLSKRGVIFTRYLDFWCYNLKWVN